MTWRVHDVAGPDGLLHVWPEQDLADHLLDGAGCVCGPFLEEQPNGAVVAVHHSLDGREKSEVDA